MSEREREAAVVAAVRELQAAWEAYAAVAPSLEDHEEEERYASLRRRFDSAVRQDVATLDTLRTLVQRTEESADSREFADFVRGSLTPYPPLALSDEETFRSHVEVGFGPDVMPIRPALALPVTEILLGGRYAEHQLDYPWSWFAGTPVGLPGDEWPRDAGGRPLVHVLQVDLGDGNGLDLEAVGLPDRGVLQVFHDLTSFGESGDDRAGAWHLRWLDDDDPDEPDRLRERARLLPWPRELSPRDRVGAVPINVDVVPTVRSPLEARPLTDEEFERYERVGDCLEWWTHVRNQAASADHRPRWSVAPTNPWAPGHVPPEPVSRLGGFGHAEKNPDLVEVLAAELPLEAGDTHHLLADINPNHFCDADWFHGGRHLEVWIRRGDLDRRRFDRVWCFIRTDA